jgi:hypothetical protein
MAYGKVADLGRLSGGQGRSRTTLLHNAAQEGALMEANASVPRFVARRNLGL